jgi:hypothetical protein
VIAIITIMTDCNATFRMDREGFAESWRILRDPKILTAEIGIGLFKSSQFCSAYAAKAIVKSLRSLRVKPIRVLSTRITNFNESLVLPRGRLVP